MAETNERLLQILSDVVKTNLATEEKINRRLSALVSGGTGRQSGTGTPRRPGSGSLRSRGSGVGAERPDDHGHTPGASQSPPQGLCECIYYG